MIFEGLVSSQSDSALRTMAELAVQQFNNAGPYRTAQAVFGAQDDATVIAIGCTLDTNPVGP